MEVLIVNLIKSIYVRPGSGGNRHKKFPDINSKSTLQVIPCQQKKNATYSLAICGKYSPQNIANANRGVYIS